jgi:hypothetical protein
LKHIDKNNKQSIAIAWVTALQESLKVLSQTEKSDSFSSVVKMIVLEVFSGKEALDLLIDSYRIREDLRADVAYPVFFKSKLVVRKFVPIAPSLKFRGIFSFSHCV